MQFNGVRAVVVDVEGTTSSIAFVKEQLYPYARNHIPPYVREHAASIQDILDEVRRIEGNSALNPSQLIAVLLHWMDDDPKAHAAQEASGPRFGEKASTAAHSARLFTTMRYAHSRIGISRD